MAGLLVDPVTRRNIDLIERTQAGQATGAAPTRDDPLSRRALLGDLARLRLQGDAERALTLLDRHVNAHGIQTEDWLHGEAVRILLHLDAGRTATAGSRAMALPPEAKRHPHMRAVLSHLEGLGQAVAPASEPTGMTGWMKGRAIGSAAGRRCMRQPLRRCGPTVRCELHAWTANAWSLHDADGSSSAMVGALGRTAKKAEPLLVGKTPPVGLHLHLCGLLVDVGGTLSTSVCLAPLTWRQRVWPVSWADHVLRRRRSIAASVLLRASRASGVMPRLMQDSASPSRRSTSKRSSSPTPICAASA